ncbi:MAG: hypothetical protein ACQ9ET_00500 [Nitrosomonadaceae bacterium]
MINIICLKYGTLYGAADVNRLYAAIKHNTNVPFVFHCFTDDIRGIHPDVHNHQLPHALPGVGWWHKLYFFSAEQPIKGRLVFMDLDTLITGNIDDILSYDKNFMVLHDFFMIRTPNNRDAYGLGKDAVQSSIMSWNSGEHVHIWNEFIKRPKEIVNSFHPHGDQKWIQQQQEEREYFQDIFPNQIVSFKIQCGGGLPSDARIVCYHGKPSISESINTTTHAQGYTIPPTPWVEEYWKDTYDS